MVAGTTAHPGPADHGKQIAHCSGTEVLEVHVDSCQGRVGFLSENGPIVVTRDADVVGDLTAQRHRRLQDRCRDLIGTAGDGVDVRALGQDFPCYLTRPPLGPQTVLHTSYEL